MFMVLLASFLQSDSVQWNGVIPILERNRTNTTNFLKQDFPKEQEEKMDAPFEKKIMKTNNRTRGQGLRRPGVKRNGMRKPPQRGRRIKSQPGVQGPSKKKKINWLHCPKCGTSFGLALYRYACGKEANNVHWMTPLEARRKHPGRKSFYGRQFMSALDLQFPITNCHQVVVEHHKFLSTKENIYAIFRNPEARLLSAFHYHCHAPGLDKMRRRTFEKNVLGETVTLARFDAFLNFPGILACQVKFAAGMECHKDLPASYNMELLLQKAVQFVLGNHMKFFGFMDEWKSTICLFAQTTSTDYRPDLEENMRNTSQLTTSTEYIHRGSTAFVSVEERSKIDETMVLSNKPAGSGIITPGFDCNDSFDSWDCKFIQAILPTYLSRVSSSGCGHHLISKQPATIE